MIFIEPIPQTGPVQLDREKAKSISAIKLVQHGGSDFRLHRDGEWAVTLTAEDALWLIDELQLAAHPSDVMRRVVIWK